MSIHFKPGDLVVCTQTCPLGTSINEDYMVRKSTMMLIVEERLLAIEGLGGGFEKTGSWWVLVDGKIGWLFDYEIEHLNAGEKN